MILLLVLIMGCSALSMVNMICGAFRRTYVKGSQQRYVFATIQRGTQWPALLAHLVAAALSARDMAFLDLAFSAAGVGVWTWFYLQLRADDDDDWFKGTGKRLKKWAQSRSFGTSLAPSTG